MAMVEICLGDVVASVVRVTGRNRHQLVQWNDSFCLISQPEPNGLVEMTISNIACWEGKHFKTEDLASLGQFFSAWLRE